MKRKILFSDDWTEISITKVRGRVIRSYSDTDNEQCFISKNAAVELAKHCLDLDNNPNAMPSHSYTREYVKWHNNK